MIRCLVLVCILLLGIAGPNGASAQSYPNRQITIVLGYPAGGITDVAARIYAEVVSRSIGQTIIIENRTGAAGVIAINAVRDARPDGYTLLLFPGSQYASLPAMEPVNYDPIRSFEPISVLFNSAALLTVPASSPVNSVPELIEYSKKKPGGLLFGAQGIGSPPHLLTSRIAASTGMVVQIIQYKGASHIMADLLTGRIDFSFPSYPAASGFFVEKKLKALAVEASERLKIMPDVPTLTEVGLGKEKVASWFALSAPAGTPPAIIEILRSEFAKASKDPQLNRRLAESGVIPNSSTPKELADMIVEELTTMKELVKMLGLQKKN